MDRVRLILGDSLWKRAFLVSFFVQIDIFFSKISLNNRQTEIYGVVWGKSNIRFQRNNYFNFLQAYLPSPCLIWVKVWFLGSNTTTTATDHLQEQLHHLHKKQQYLSYYWHAFDQTLKQRFCIHNNINNNSMNNNENKQTNKNNNSNNNNISAITDPILTKL